MIRSFADKETERLFATGATRRLPQDIVRRALSRLKYLDIATSAEDLRDRSPITWSFFPVTGPDNGASASTTSGGCAFTSRTAMPST